MSGVPTDAAAPTPEDVEAARIALRDKRADTLLAGLRVVVSVHVVNAADGNAKTAVTEAIGATCTLLASLCKLVKAEPDKVLALLRDEIERERQVTP